MKISRTAQALFENILQDLIEKARGLDAAIISSIDGFQIAAVIPNKKSVGKIAAMSSSLHALGQAISSEVQRGECKQLVVHGQQGSVVVLQIPHQNPPLLLNLVTQEGIDLARLDQVAQACAQRIASKLALTS